MSELHRPVTLITGATSGIGYATARHLLATGANVIVHGPTTRSAQQAATRLVHGGADPTRLDVAAADFSRLADVARMARQLSARYDRIDVLVNNAAIAGPPSRTLTEDGNELTSQVNYLAPFLLTRLMTPALRAARGRMVAVSSVLHRTGNINWSDPQRHNFYSPVEAYSQSKLGLTMFARAMAHQHLDVTAVSVHPGVVETDLMDIYGNVGRPVDDAAAAVARLCSPETAVLGGGYYDGDNPARPALLVDDGVAVARLWKLTTRILGQYRFVPARAA